MAPIAAVPANRHRVWLSCLQIRTGFDSPFPEFSNEIACVGMKLQKSCVAPLPIGDFDFVSKRLFRPPGY